MLSIHRASEEFPKSEQTQIVVREIPSRYFSSSSACFYFYICNNFAIFSFYCPVLKIEGFALFSPLNCRARERERKRERKGKFILFDKQIVDYF
jgi:hypothetical protein